jgi:hypothetical protein
MQKPQAMLVVKQQRQRLQQQLQDRQQVQAQ